MTSLKTAQLAWASPAPFESADELRRGFTIVELMAVTALIALLIGVSVPLIFKIDELSRDRTGINSIGVAVSAARAYATRRIGDSTASANAEYSGAAVLFTPFNELRIIEDVQEPTLEDQQLSGYSDIAKIDPISMPRGVGILGIVRDDSTVAGVPAGGRLWLLPPPFVVRFNRHGQLVAESRTATTDPPAVRRNTVIYDINGSFSTGSARNRAQYDPRAYDPDLVDIGAKWDAGANSYRLHFQSMEAVVGVLTYSKADFEDAGGAFPATAPTLGCLDGTCGNPSGSVDQKIDGINEWMWDNGNVIFFSRYSGTILRVNRP